MEKKLSDHTKLLPQDEQVLNKEYAQISLKEIEKNLAWAVEVNDIDRGFAFWNRYLSDWFLLSHPLGNESAESLLRVYLKVVRMDWIDNVYLSKCISTLSQILKRCKQEKLEISLDFSWKDFHSLMEGRFFSERYKGVLKGEVSFKSASENLVRLSRSLRRFWKDEERVSKEILDALLPLACPKEKSFFKSVAYLHLLLPESGWKGWLEQVMTLWKQVDADKTFYEAMISLVTRASKKGGSEIDWSNHVDFIFSEILFSFNVTLGSNAAKLPHISNPIKCPSEYKWMVKDDSILEGTLLFHLLQSKQAELVRQKIGTLFSTVETFTHPSNGGEWSSKISGTILGLLYRLAKKKNKGGALNKHENSLVELLLSLSFNLLFSKKDNVSESARKLIHYLCEISPDTVLPKVVEVIYIGLETQFATHQTLIVLELLALISPNLFDGKWQEGAKHLPNLLNMTLSAIDFNDNSKTLATFKFYFSLFSIVPISDKLSNPNSEFETQVSDGDPFGDWIFLFTDQILTFLSHHGKSEKEEQNWHQRIENAIFKQTMRVIFAQLCHNLHKRILTKISEHVDRSIHMNALPQYQQIFSALSLASTSSTLEKVISMVSRKLLKEKKLKSVSESETVWCLGILAGSVKWAGANLLPHLPSFLVPLLEQTIFHESEKVRKMANKVLRRLMESLSRRYPTEYRSAPPSSWKQVEQGKAFQVWGKRYKLSETSEEDISWHIPNEDEIEQANSLFKKFLEASLDKIHSESSNSEQLTSSLRVISSILGNISGTLLPATDQPVFGEIEDEGFPPLKKISFVSFENSNVLEGLRKKIGEELENLASKLISSQSEDVQTLKQLCKTLYVFINEPSVSETKLRSHKMVYWMLKKKWAVPGNKKLLFRSLVVERAYCQHLRRLSHANGAHIVDSQLNRTLLSHLQALSTHLYSDVRKDAQSIFHVSVGKFPVFLYKILPLIIKNLSADIPEHQIKGTIHLLLSKTVISRLSKKWWLSDLFIYHIMRAFIHKEASVQIRVYQLFFAFAASFYPKPLTVPLPSSVTNSSLSQEIVALATQRLSKVNNKNQSRYKSSLESLEKLLSESSKLHWRYQLMASACLLLLFHREAKVSKNVSSWFSRCLISDVSPLRSLAYVAVELISDKSRAKTVVTLSEPKDLFVSEEKLLEEQSEDIYSPQKWDATHFRDTNREGWSHFLNRQVMNSSSAQINESEEFEPVRNFLSESAHLSKFLSFVSHDHSVESSETEKLGDRIPKGLIQMAHKFLSHMGRGSGALAQDMSEEVAGKLIHQLWKRHSSIPHTFGGHFPVDGFKLDNAFLFNSLFRSLGADFFVEKVANVLLPLLQSHSERSEQCTAAEVLSGLLRASRHFPFDQQKKIWEIISSPFQEALSKAAPDTIGDFVTCIRFFASHRDPRRLAWISNNLSKAPLEGDTSLAKSKNLFYLRALLSEFSWRGLPLASKLLNVLTQKDQLQSHYKQIRVAVAETISTILSTSSREQLPKSFHKILEKVFLENLSKESDLAENEQHERSTLLHVVEYTAKHNEIQVLIPVLPLAIRLVLFSHLSHDKETQQFARHTLALLVQSPFPPTIFLEKILPELKSLSSHSSWHLRLAIHPFLQIGTFNVRMHLSESQYLSVVDVAVSFLSDSQVEVRESATTVLTSLLTGYSHLSHKHLAQFSKLSSLPIPRVTRKSSATSNNEELKKNIVPRHAGVLGMCAVVLSSPYTVPDHLPKLLVQLGAHINDPYPIVESVKKTISDFFKSHQDNWEQHEKHFTEEQLSSVNELKQGTRNYLV